MFFTTQRRPAHRGAGADVPDTRSRQDGGPVSDHDHDDQITLAVDAVFKAIGQTLVVAVSYLIVSAILVGCAKYATMTAPSAAELAQQESASV